MKKLGMLMAVVALGVSSMAQAAGSTQVTASLPTCKTPEYPLIAFLNGEEGTMEINVLVSEKGEILDTKTLKTSGFWNLDHATRRALNKCTFTPVQGKATWQSVRYNWNIEA